MTMKEIGEIQKEKLVKKHTGLIIKIAYEIWKAYNLPIDFLSDLVQEGYIGFLESLDNFDSSKGTKLSTYSFPRIWGSMIKFLKKNNFIHIPDEKLKKIRKILFYRNFLFTDLGRVPNSKEIAQETGYTMFQVEVLEEISKMFKVGSLNSPVRSSYEEGVKELKDFVYANREITPEAKIMKKEIKEKLWETIESLPQLDKNIISKRFGLKDAKEYSIRDLSKIFGISRYKVEKIELDTIYKLANEKELVQMRIPTYNNL